VPGTNPAADRQLELREFLQSRRARLTPADVGLPERRSDRRRVPGLRREELAMLAAWPPDAYRRFEQERLAHVTVEMLERLADALCLDDDDRRRLFALGLPDGPDDEPVVPPPAPRPRVRPGVRQILRALMPAPAYVLGRRTDILAYNPTAASVLGLSRHRRANLTRTLFSPVAPEIFEDWETAASDAIATLRQDVVRYPDDPHTATLIGELSILAPDFRQRWLDGDEEPPRGHGQQVLHHPDVGRLDLRWEALRVDDARDQVLIAYTPVRRTRTTMALRILAELIADPSATT